MLSYPGHPRKTNSGYVVTFRDIPEASTEGPDLVSALDNAADALSTAMEFYFEDRREVPLPSRERKGESLVSLPASLSAKIMLLNAMLKERVTPAELARKLGTSPQAVTRIIDLRHATKIDTIADALRVLGKKMVIDVVDA